MDDGFFEGELNGVTGLVPSNFVQSVLDGTNGTFESDEVERRNYVALYGNYSHINYQFLIH